MKRAGEIFRYSCLQSQPAASVCAVVQPHCSGNGHSRGGRPDQSACFSTMRTFYLERKKKSASLEEKLNGLSVILLYQQTNTKKVKWGIFCVEHNHFSPRAPHTPLHSGKSVYCPLLDFREFLYNKFCFSLARTVSEVHLRTSQTSGRAATVPRATLRDPLKQRKRIKKIKRALHLVCMSTTITPPVL